MNNFEVAQVEDTQLLAGIHGHQLESLLMELLLLIKRTYDEAGDTLSDETLSDEKCDN